MATTIRTRIVTFGDSQGTCIPRVLLEQANLVGEAELELQDQ